MSSFKENFERGEKEKLDYDDSAFYYFSLTLLTVILLPITWIFILKPVIKGDIQILRSKLKNCNCSSCQTKIKERAQFYRYSWFNGWFVVRLVVIGTMWALWAHCAIVVKDIEPLKTFIPHEILGVATDASVADVKRAYRKLSREKHPDKNPDNPEAVNEFIQITKAYTIMTDEKARENFLKYGNPDGKGSFAVGIALPNVLQKKEYQLQVLLVFFVVVVFLMPYYFMSNIMANEKDVGGVDIQNRQIFTDLINENMLGK
jgi:translocation protein SEC63